jgi:hypothetical protein
MSTKIALVAEEGGVPSTEIALVAEEGGVPNTETVPTEGTKAEIRINQVGRFRLPVPRSFADIKFMSAIMRHIVVLECRMLPYSGMLEYLAYSQMFKTLDMGETIPWYNFIISYTGSKTKVIVDMLEHEPMVRYNQED